jgi:hypothetical protein
MGAKTWMLVYADGDARTRLAAGAPLDRDATVRLAAELFPKEKLEALEDTALAWTAPPDAELAIGCFPGVEVVAAKEFGGDYPSKLDPRFLARAAGRTVTVHAMHSVVDWFAFAVWRDGTLVRALSASPDHGVIEDIGPRLPFEEPYWRGEHAVEEGEADAENEALPFHPLELGEAALGALFGYHLEGPIDSTLIDPDAIPLMRFKRKRKLLGLFR